MPRPPRAPPAPCGSAAPLSASNRCMAAGGRRTGTSPPTGGVDAAVGDRRPGSSRATSSARWALVAEPLVRDDRGRQAVRVADRGSRCGRMPSSSACPRPIARAAACAGGRAERPARAVARLERLQAVGLADLRIEDVHRRLADEGGDEQVGRAVLQLLPACANCCSTPASITAMRSASAIASVWSWVTKIGRHAALDQIVLDARAQDGAQLRLELATSARRAGRGRRRGPAPGRGWRAAAGRPRSWADSGRGCRRSRAARRSAPTVLRDLGAWRAARAAARSRYCRGRSAADRAHSPRTPWRRCARAGSRLVDRRSPRRIAPVGHVLEAGDHAQGRGLAAARGAEQRRRSRRR